MREKGNAELTAADGIASVGAIAAATREEINKGAARADHHGYREGLARGSAQRPEGRRELGLPK